jgi:hypothetical protein
MVGFIVRYVIIIVLTVSWMGCGTVKPFEYTDPSETKKGAGLISGKKGEFILFQK